MESIINLMIFVHVLTTVGGKNPIWCYVLGNSVSLFVLNGGISNNQFLSIYEQFAADKDEDQVTRKD